MLEFNNRYAKAGMNIALKTYFLFCDTDIDLMTTLSNNGASSFSFGFDFARNLKENLEIHGEASHFNNTTKYSIASNALNTESVSGSSYLFGFRYLNRWNTTVIAEYYHNGAGLTAAQYQSYRSYVNTQLASGSSEAVQQAAQNNQDYFSSSTLMQDYLYLKISQPEPFGWLYFTPSLYSIVNLSDGSFLLAAPLSFTRFTNFEIVLWPTILVGAEGSEYGDKQFQKKLEMWMRFYF